MMPYMQGQPRPFPQQMPYGIMPGAAMPYGMMYPQIGIMGQGPAGARPMMPMMGMPQMGISQAMSDHGGMDRRNSSSSDLSHGRHMGGRRQQQQQFQQ